MKRTVIPSTSSSSSSSVHLLQISRILHYHHHRHLIMLLLLLLLLSPLPPAVGSSVAGMSQAVQQLTQRFATLEVSLESRLVRLTDTATKGEAVMETLASRLDKVDSLVETVEELEERLSQESSTIHSTIVATTTSLQGLESRLERLDTLVRGSEAWERRGEREEGGGGRGGGRHDIRSSWNGHSIPDAELLGELVRRSVEDAVESALSHTLTTFHNTIYSRLNKSVGELQAAVEEAREGLEELGARTLATATEARQDIRQGGKTTQEAVRNISDKIHSVHQDLSLKISSPPSLHTLGPVLRQVNHSVVESITRATQNINVSSLLDHATLRTGSVGRSSGRGGRGGGHQSSLQESHALHCPDPTTVAALLEVRQLLQTLLKKSEDLRRGLTKQTSEGVDLLKLLHQRFSVLLRRMNTEPDHGQMLVSEMQDLGSLVEASYMAVLVAQNAFIDSCKRIQDEEPMLELKMTEILDKLVTNIDLGYQHNRQQLSELKEVVQRLGQGVTPLTLTPQDDDGSGEALREEAVSNRNSNSSGSGSGGGGSSLLPPRLVQVRSILAEVLDTTNSTVDGLERVETRVEEVATHLLNTDWSHLRQKEPADQLVTAAKDLKGYTQEQILRSLELYETLVAALGYLDTTTTTTTSTSTTNNNTTALPHLQLRSSGGATTLTLPASCTAVLVNHFRELSRESSSSSMSPSPATSLEEEEDEEEDRGNERVEEEDVEEEDEDDADNEDEEDVPLWYTDPDFLSGN